MTEPAYASAAQRNSAPILALLKHELKDCRSLLEIGSGTGLHAVVFADELPHTIWQTSDLDETHGWIQDRIARSGLENVLPPITLDVRAPTPADQTYDAVFSCNTMHIMSKAAVEKMIRHVGTTLRRGGVFCYYGPFRRHDRFNTASNAAFHEALQSRDVEMGIRELENVDQLAADSGMQRQRVYAMPANNYLVVWKKTGTGGPS